MKTWNMLLTSVILMHWKSGTWGTFVWAVGNWDSRIHTTCIIHTYIHTYVHTYINTYIHTYIYICIYLCKVIFIKVKEWNVFIFSVCESEFLTTFIWIWNNILCSELKLRYHFYGINYMPVILFLNELNWPFSKFLCVCCERRDWSSIVKRHL